MEYYIMEKADQFYREAMAKHGLANCVSPMIKDIVFMIVEKMEKDNLAEIKKLQDQINFRRNEVKPLKWNGASNIGCPPSDK